MLSHRMLNQKNKKSHIVTKTIIRKSTSSNDALAMSGPNLEELAKTILPSLKGSVEAAIFLKKMTISLPKCTPASKVTSAVSMTT